MEEKKIDRRVIKTKKAIRKAFVELLTQKHINDITIKDIAELADINRKTFYNYYAGVHELLEEFENDMVEKFEENLSDFDFDTKYTDRTFSMLSDHIEDDLLYRKLLLSKHNSHLMEKIMSVLRDKTINFLAEKYDADKTTLSIMTIFISSGLMNVYEYYLSSDSDVTREEISDILANIIENGIRNYVPTKRR